MNIKLAEMQDRRAAILCANLAAFNKEKVVALEVRPEPPRPWLWDWVKKRLKLIHTKKQSP